MGGKNHGKKNDSPARLCHDFSACFVSPLHLVFACNSFLSIQAIEEFDSFLERIIIFPFTNVKPRSQWIDGLGTFIGRFKRDYQRRNEGLAGDGRGRLCL